MSYDNEWLEKTLEDRRQSILATIRQTSREEVCSLGRERFPSANDPWAEAFEAFLKEHPKDHYYLAKTPEEAEIVYCREEGRAIWFLPGKGMGIVQPKGLAFLAEAVAAL